MIRILKKEIYLLLPVFLYLSLIFGFLIDEDLNGGAKKDYIHAYKPIIENFIIDFKYTFLNYEQYGQRHSPVLIIVLSFLTFIFKHDIIVRILHLHVSILLFIFFFLSLKTKFNFLSNKNIIVISSVIFLSPTVRSLAIWPDSRLLGLIFFVLSIFFFLKFKKEKKKYFFYSILNTIFLGISAYISPNFSLFSIYFFYYFIKRLETKEIFLIILLNFFLAFPALYYIFILKIFFLTSGKTPGYDEVGTSFDLNFSNKILIISSIFFFHLLNFILYKDFFEKIKKFIYEKKNFFIILAFSLLLIYNFNYSLKFTGGGIFLHLSNYIFKSNIFFFIIIFFSLFLIYFLTKKNFNNFLLFLILVISNIQLSIYHKYYEPLIFIMFLLLFEVQINFKKFFSSKNNIFYIYAIFVFFLFASFLKIKLQI